MMAIDDRAMPEWLLKDENYTPGSGKDAFVNKSILALLGVLSKIKAQGGHRLGGFNVNAVLKVPFTFILVILLSISKSFTFIAVIYVYLLIILSLLKGDTILKILKISFLMSFFTFIILLPAAFGGNVYSGITIPSKVFASMMAVNMLSYSTGWNSITSVLKRFWVPDIFILVLDITIKYIVSLGEFALNMLYALKLRLVGRNKSKYASLSGVAGTMFIKSMEMAEDMYLAMECRGFTGEYKVQAKFRFGHKDFFYVIVNIGLVLAFIYFGKV